MTTRIVFTLLWLAGDAAFAQQNVVIQTETRVVLVDAIVTRKNGEYVRDLAAKDFRIWQDGKEQSIKSLSLEVESQPHYLVLFFDNTRMVGPDQILARQAASNFIDANAGPNHLVALVSFNGGMQIAQNFTDNAGRLKDGLARVESSGATDDRAAAAELGARNMVRSLGNLAKGLGVLPGRKIVVLLSGKSSSFDQKSEVRNAIEAANKSGVAIYPVDVRPVSVQSESGPATSALPAERHRPTQNTKGPQGEADEFGASAQDSGASSQQYLHALASGTGGIFIHNSSELLAGLQQIGQEQSAYYTLSFTPPEAKEGSCHALRVKVERSATTVRARSNYCTSKPQDLLAGTSAGKDLESRAASAQPGTLAASMQLPYFYISPGVARVNLAMEIAPNGVKFVNQKGRLHADINLLGIATTADGSVGARFSDALPLDFGSEAEIKGTLHYEKEFKIAPGQYGFTLAFSSGGASFGKLEMPLSVDRWNPGELAVSGVALSREAHPAADLGLAASLIETRTPLVTDGVQIVPSGSNQFANSEAAFFYFEVYDPNPEVVRIQVRVLDRKGGEQKTDSGPMKLEVAKIGPNSPIPAGSRLPTNGLAPGSYQLEVMAVEAGKQVKRVADFEIK